MPYLKNQIIYKIKLIRADLYESVFFEWLKLLSVKTTLGVLHIFSWAKQAIMRVCSWRERVIIRQFT